MPKEDRHRAYFCTWNNYTEKDYDDVKSYIQTETDYGCLCKEKAPTTGTPHIHFYIYFKNKKTFDALKKKYPKVNIKVSDAKRAQAALDYCKKEDEQFFEFGTIPMQGSRQDLKDIKDDIESGETMRDMIPGFNNYQHIRVAETMMKYYEPVRKWKPNVLWYYGETGTGKSKTAWELFPDAYEKKSDSKWWDGYDAHPDVIIDDFRPSHIDFVELLKILDRYPCKVEVKGGFRQFLAKNIVITAPECPRQMYYCQQEDVQQLLRRIDKIIFFPKDRLS